MTERAQALEAAMRKIRAHTSYNPAAGRAFLAELLASVERIADAALLAVQPPPPVGSPTTEDIPQLVQRFDLVSVSFAYTSDHEMERADDGEWVRFDDVFPPASLAPVEPTPLSERHLPPAVVMLVSAASAASGYLERLQPDLAVRLWAGVQAVISTPDKTVEPKPLTGAELLDRFRQVEPAPPTPAPCVWREAVQINHAPFVDTPVKQAKRRAFDDPTIANLDALIGVVIAAEAKPLRDALELIRTMTQGVSPTAAINVAAEVWSICRDALSRRTDR